MDILIILNGNPYDGSDKTWNALRLANTLLQKECKVCIFLMNDSVDLARDKTVKPDYYDTDLVAMLKELMGKGLVLKVCGTCQARCGIHKNEPYFSPDVKSTMNELAELVINSGKVITF
ncbi:MAG: DsrE/DsrF/TusD sulfur relay family protein [Deferribacterales bacterium]